jgi:hypothetical protein
MKSANGFATALLSLSLALPLAAAAEPVPPPDAPPMPAPPAPEQIWQAGLARIAGNYRFVQIASPGGLWQKTVTAGKEDVQQLSLSQLPKALREQLQKAEIEILDLQTPTTVKASSEKSPGVGGMLRHYSEDTPGRLVMRGLPGIGSVDGDSGNFSGGVIFGLDHTSLSTPSVPGVLFTRAKTEATWGAATLDYAELIAQKPLPKGQEDGDPQYPIFNARILRSGVEIFAFFQWTDPEAKKKGTQREIWGTVRLLRVNGDTAPPPAPTPAKK